MLRSAPGLALAAALLFPLAARAERHGRPDPNEVYAVPVGDSPYRGPRHAEVTLVMATEFACPFCVRVKPTIEKLIDEELEKANRRIKNRRQLRRYYRRYVVKRGKKKLDR